MLRNVEKYPTEAGMGLVREGLLEAELFQSRTEERLGISYEK